MKKISTQINRKYTVTSPNGCRVCADNGLQLCVVAAGQQADFTAISHFVEVDDESAVVSLLFHQRGGGTPSTGNASQLYIVGVLPATLQSNCVYDLGELGAEVDFSVLQFGDNGSVQTAELWFSTGLVLPDISWPENAIWLDEVPVLMNNTAYRVVLRYEPSGMLIFNLAYEYTI